MSWIKIRPRPEGMEQNDPNYLTYETSQSFEIQFDLVNDAEQIYVNSSEPDYFDNFNTYNLKNHS